MNKEVVRKWLTALRSGKYKQLDGRLRVDDHYCVLGVLCSLHSCFGKAPNTFDYTGTGWDFTVEGGGAKFYSYLGYENELPPEIGDWMGTDYIHLEEQVAIMNDEGVGFKELADFIENKMKEIDPEFVA